MEVPGKRGGGDDDRGVERQDPGDSRFPRIPDNIHDPEPRLRTFIHTNPEDGAQRPTPADDVEKNSALNIPHERTRG